MAFLGLQFGRTIVDVIMRRPSSAIRALQFVGVCAAGGVAGYAATEAARAVHAAAKARIARAKVIRQLADEMLVKISGASASATQRVPAFIAPEPSA